MCARAGVEGREGGGNDGETERTPHQLPTKLSMCLCQIGVHLRPLPVHT